MDLPRWVIADTHFRHQAITRYCQRPDDVDALMLREWKATIGPRESVLHLGDIVWKDADYVRDKLSRLPGRIQFIRGNHDKQVVVDALLKIGWELVNPFDLTFEDHTIQFTHYPIPPPLATKHLNVHGHTHNNEAEYSVYHLNVSVEEREYRPVDLRLLLERRIEVLSYPELLAEHVQQLAQDQIRRPRFVKEL